VLSAARLPVCARANRARQGPATRIQGTAPARDRGRLSGPGSGRHGLARGRVQRSLRPHAGTALHHGRLCDGRNRVVRPARCADPRYPPTTFPCALTARRRPCPADSTCWSLIPSRTPNGVPPEQPDSKSKGGISTGGQGGQGEPPPTPPKMPFELVRPMQQQVQKAALPEGDRPLPQAGLLFFEHRGETKHIKSLELIYSGPRRKSHPRAPALAQLPQYRSRLDQLADRFWPPERRRQD
jgi:hypothetical protein